MKSRGFTRSMEDLCVYLKRMSNEVFSLIILVLYVDDMLIAAKDKSKVEKVKAQLSAEFSMKDLGPAKRILGMEIHRDVKGGRLWLTQGKYTRKVLEKFNMLDAKLVGTPGKSFQASTLNSILSNRCYGERVDVEGSL
ncbi:hypothetical protein R1flu_023168 [Riccia fluitans]|uniref:Reverse transcriptase Ty1/copia-type domain-containing protein n=1 Tax=Riccia fluitans TaxID=41844 RepID=A0ABD1XU79_9MARC